MVFQKYFLSCTLRCDFCPRLSWRYNERAKPGLKSISEDGKIRRLTCCDEVTGRMRIQIITLLSFALQLLKYLSDKIEKDVIIERKTSHAVIKSQPRLHHFIV